MAARIEDAPVTSAELIRQSFSECERVKGFSVVDAIGNYNTRIYGYGNPLKWRMEDLKSWTGSFDHTILVQAILKLKTKIPIVEPTLNYGAVWHELWQLVHFHLPVVTEAEEAEREVRRHR